MQRERIKDILFKTEFINELIILIFSHCQDNLNYIQNCRDILTNISDDLDKSNNEYFKFLRLIEVEDSHFTFFGKQK